MPQETNERYGAGDAYVTLDLVPEDLSDVAFERLREEVEWKVMYHRGGEVPRLVAVQGQVDEDGSFPIYRHPADESPPLLPFSPTVQLIREQAQKVIHHPLNHVLIQCYRSGSDYISEHSDKTIDVVKKSNIVNVSFGAQRTMVLRLKKDAFTDPTAPPESEKDPSIPGPKRPTERIPLPHNSMFVMGLSTNQWWLHSIHRDNRPPFLKSAPEQSHSGERISLTFRQIGTFLSKDQKKIWGQGARGKTKEEAGEVVNGAEEGARLIQAFGRENHESGFDWEEGYGAGYDVVHFSETAREGAM